MEDMAKASNLMKQACLPKFKIPESKLGFSSHLKSKIDLNEISQKFQIFWKTPRKTFLQTTDS